VFLQFLQNSDGNHILAMTIAEAEQTHHEYLVSPCINKKWLLTRSGFAPL
jgi:hypothetical protein